MADADFTMMEALMELCQEKHIDQLYLCLLYTSKAAYKVEAAAIDLLGLKNLTNKQSGHESSLYGR